MLLRHTLIYFAGFAASGAIAILATSTYTRLISPAEYGQYAVLQMFLAAVLAGGFEWTRVSLLRSLGHGKPKDSGFFTDYAILYAGGAAVAVAVAAVLEYEGTYSLRTSAWMFAALWAMAQAAMDVILIHARVGMRPMHYVGFQVARAAASFMLSVVFVLLGFGAVGLVLGITLANAGLAAVGATLYRPRHVGFRIREASTAHMREIAAFGVPVGVAALLGFGVGYADRLLVATFLDPADVGAYAFTGDFVQRTLVLLNVVVNTAAYPLTAKIFEEHGKEAAGAQMTYNLALLAAILVPAAAGLCIAADVVARVVAGAAFREQFVWILPWLVLSGLIGALRYYVCDLPLQLVKETRMILWPAAVTLALSAGLGLALIPRLGVAGALAAANAGQIIGLAVSARVARSILRFAMPWREFAKIAAAVAATAAVYYAIADRGDLIGGLAAMVAAAGAYAAVLVLLDGLGLRRRLIELAGRSTG